MMIYVVLLVVVVMVIFLLTRFILSHSETVVITWGSWGNIEINSTDLFIIFLIAFIALYLALWALKSLLFLPRNFKKYRKTRLSIKAEQEFIQGLIQFGGAYWNESETLLLKNIAQAKTPFLNYLVVARAAHMQGHYEDRDHYLKQAAKTSDKARITVAVSQAEMQLASKQLEQARATLVHLLALSPNHSYANKLLAKVYFNQEDWKNLFALLPHLKKKQLLSETSQQYFETFALKGIFQVAALKDDAVALDHIWKTLAPEIKNTPQAILNYCDALIATKYEKKAEKILFKALNKQWDVTLVERFGEIAQLNLKKSIQSAEKWLEESESNPEILLCLARLYRANKRWAKSSGFYEKSLNMSPNTTAYLEFAELLTQLHDDKSAADCYQKGLKYCVHQRVDTLHLKLKPAADPSKMMIAEDDVEIYYSI
ncbi:MAG: heme biosynthesis protein HemY [Cocleimonas sp.]|nr:heme biosynthesis protein HemY [Cocleimonas sp.]